MKYPAKNPAKFLKPEPDIEAGYLAGSGFSQITGRFLLLTLHNQSSASFSPKTRFQIKMQWTGSVGVLKVTPEKDNKIANKVNYSSEVVERS